MIDMKKALQEMRNDLIDEIKSRLLTVGDYPHRASGNLEASLLIGLIMQIIFTHFQI